MSKILILGGYGYTGKLLAKHLLIQTDAEIIISGRNLEKAKSFAGQMVAYRAAIETATGAPVIGTFIHFPISGYLVNVAVNGSAEMFLARCIPADGIRNP